MMSSKPRTTLLLIDATFFHAELGFLALFPADDEMDAAFARLLKSTPSQMERAFNTHVR